MPFRVNTFRLWKTWNKFYFQFNPFPDFRHFIVFVQNSWLSVSSIESSKLMPSSSHPLFVKSIFHFYFHSLSVSFRAVTQVVSHWMPEQKPTDRTRQKWTAMELYWNSTEIALKQHSNGTQTDSFPAHNSLHLSAIAYTRHYSWDFLTLFKLISTKPLES